jgi:hypothetical protein
VEALMARTGDAQTNEQSSETLVGDSDVLSSEASGESIAAADESVALRAYRRFEERGGVHGRDVDDWLEAERDLRDGNGG